MRTLSAEERRLWESATRAVAPLRPAAAAHALPPESGIAAAGPVQAAGPSTAVPEQVPRRPADRFAAPPLVALGRRQRHRVARGSAPLDARIDLHGMTQERAHRALLGFLRAAQANDARLVLVITGKGARPGAGALGHERGVLKRMVPHWLSLPEFRPLVIGLESAHATHGGEGALYVRVRRMRG